MKKIEFYGDINEELGVVMAFSKLHESLGFSKLVPSSARGFDIASIEYNGFDVTVEFEYVSSNFIAHGHPDNMEPDRKYVVVCWEDDCGLASLLKDNHNVELYDIVELRKYVSIKQDICNKSSEEPIYVILSYNPKNADNKDFGEWVFSNCYRTPTDSNIPKFAKDSLPAASRVLFYQNGYIIGGCTVVRYEVIDPPKTKREWELYKQLSDYPISLYTMTVDEYKADFSRGHIFYNDFFDIRDSKIKLSNYIDKKMSRQGKMNITRDEYFRILGH